jgi:hypothetical protein
MVTPKGASKLDRPLKPRLTPLFEKGELEPFKLNNARMVSSAPVLRQAYKHSKKIELSPAAPAALFCVQHPCPTLLGCTKPVGVFDPLLSYPPSSSQPTPIQPGPIRTCSAGPFRVCVRVGRAHP